jgi:hypothetical protein
VSERTLCLTTEGQLTERFTAAIEQLGAVGPNNTKPVEIRIGGVYALGAYASEADNADLVKRILQAYVDRNVKDGAGTQADVVTGREVLRTIRSDQSRDDSSCRERT